MKTQKELTQLLAKQVEEISLSQQVELAGLKDTHRDVEAAMLKLNVAIRALKDPALLKTASKVYDALETLASELQAKKQW